MAAPRTAIFIDWWTRSLPKQRATVRRCAPGTGVRSVRRVDAAISSGVAAASAGLSELNRETAMAAYAVRARPRAVRSRVQDVDG